MTSWIFIINHMRYCSRICNMHKFDNCVFYFYANNWFSHSATINLFPKGWDLLSHSLNFPFFLDPGLYSIQVPWFHVIQLVLLSVPSPLTLIISYLQNPSLPSYTYLKENPLDLANILIYFLPFTSKLLKCTICARGFCSLPSCLGHHMTEKLPPIVPVTPKSPDFSAFSKDVEISVIWQHRAQEPLMTLALNELAAACSWHSSFLHPPRSLLSCSQPKSLNTLVTPFKVTRLSSKQIHQNNSTWPLQTSRLCIICICCSDCLKYFSYSSMVDSSMLF